MIATLLFFFVSGIAVGIAISILSGDQEIVILRLDNIRLRIRMFQLNVANAYINFLRWVLKTL